MYINNSQIKNSQGKAAYIIGNASLYAKNQIQTPQFNLNRVNPNQVQNSTPPNGLFQKMQGWINKNDQKILNYVKSYAPQQSTQVSTVNIQDLKNAQETLSLIARPDVPEERKVLAITQLLNQLSQVSFEGTVNAPKTVEGQAVVASTITNTGKPGFVLADGKVVDQSSLVTAQNLNVALNTLGLLQGNQSNTNQILGIGNQAVLLANANNLISDNTAGHLSSVLGIASAITNWNDMSDAQRLTGLANTVPQILNSAQNLGVNISNTTIGNVSSVLGLGSTIANWQGMSGEQRISAVANTSSALIGTANSLGAEIGSSAAGSALGAIGGVAGLYTGVDQAINVFGALGDMSRSEGSRYGAIGGGSAGAAIGAGVATVGVATGAIVGSQLGSAVLPIVGTVIGAAVGALAGFVAGKFGSSKSPDQMLRDSWRKGLEQAGFADKINGSHYVPLADGSAYNIGVDGKHKLTNLDGTQRQTFDVDWSNPLSGDAIPEAHIYALASGLDPSVERGLLWHRATAQAVNAATSNATDSATVTANFQSMLAKAQVDPMNLALKIEVLRQQNKVNDNDYVVYMGKINELFNTQFQPVDRQTALEALRENGMV